MDCDKFQIGDHVIISSTNSKSMNIIGKIEEIFIEGDQKKFKYNEFYFPEKTYSKYFLN